MQFVWAGVIKQLQMGAILPSQRFLIDKMIAPIPESYRGQVIELGAGNGALTLRLAAKCPYARILACEINPALARYTRLNLKYAGLSSRVTVKPSCAEKLLADMAGSAVEHPDFVVSGVPIGNLSKTRTVALLDLISRVIAEGGMYIQFQHFLRDRKTVKAIFPNLRTIPVFLNFPPAVVYYARK
jgi:phospholipid N-methyltransferase